MSDGASDTNPTDVDPEKVKSKILIEIDDLASKFVRHADKNVTGVSEFVAKTRTNLSDGLNQLTQLLSSKIEEKHKEVELLKADSIAKDEQLAKIMNRLSQLEAQAVKPAASSPPRKKPTRSDSMNRSQASQQPSQVRKNCSTESTLTMDTSDVLDEDEEEFDIFVQKKADKEARGALMKAKKSRKATKTKSANKKEGSKAAKQSTRAESDMETDDNQANDGKQADGDQSSNKEQSNSAASGENSIPKAKVLRPPPIKVTSADRVEDFVPIIRAALPDEKLWTVQALASGIFKVNPMSEEAHRVISGALAEKNIKYYTFENSHTRPVRVIAKKLHESLDVQDIFNDLKVKGFNIIKVDNIIKKIRKTDKEGKVFVEPKILPMFVLTFSHGEDIKKINEIKGICNMICSIEPLRRNSRQVPQCTKCQIWGHTKNFCGKDPKCVKCGEGHPSLSCPHGKFIEKPKCANCNECHVASFRSCVVAKAAIEKRAKQLKQSPKNSGKSISLPAEKDFPALPPSKGKKKNKKRKKGSPTQPVSSEVAQPGTSPSSFSQVLKAKPTQVRNLNLETILAQILSKLEILEVKYDNLNLRIDSADKARSASATTRAAALSPSKR